MITKNFVLENRYYDSVVLMNAAGKIKEEVGAHQVSLMMGTGANKELLSTMNLLTPEGDKAQAGDLIVAIQVEDPEIAPRALDALEGALAPQVVDDGGSYTPRSIDGAVQMLPGANLAVISIPGEYVDWEVDKLLDRDIHAMIFSDNVPLETEIALKKKGEQKGLLVMGPDCGTSIISGSALGFANRVRRGNIGIVAAAGTGIQEVSTLIHKMGGGISHAIGTGGRDLSRDVGGITMKMGIRALIEDEATEVLCLVSKPPHPDVEAEIYDIIKNTEKPVVVNLLGSDGKQAKALGFLFAPTLEEAALLSVKAAGGKASLPEPPEMDEVAAAEVKKLAPTQKYLRGLYSGGTLTNETRLILEGMGYKLYSNVTKNPPDKLKNPLESLENTLVDMGDDTFTKGAPHPMIDQTKRLARIHAECEDPETAIVLLDLVLGYGAHENPGEEMAQTIIKARKKAGLSDRHIIFVASVCGVPEDPQDADRQKEAMEKAGVYMFPSNASATRFVGRLMSLLLNPVKGGRQ